MRKRKYLGPIAGLGLSLLMAATVLATTTSGTWYSQPPGTNTPLMQNINSTTFSFWSSWRPNARFEVALAAPCLALADARADGLPGVHLRLPQVSGDELSLAAFVSLSGRSVWVVRRWLRAGLIEGRLELDSGARPRWRIPASSLAQCDAAEAKEIARRRTAHLLSLGAFAAAAGVSRREVEGWIADGRVRASARHSARPSAGGSPHRSSGGYGTTALEAPASPGPERGSSLPCRPPEMRPIPAGKGGSAAGNNLVGAVADLQLMGYRVGLVRVDERENARPASAGPLQRDLDADRRTVVQMRSTARGRRARAARPGTITLTPAP
jgi:hypothetical protein